MPRTPEPILWLSLVDVSGPFLAGTVLEEAFPQGLEKVETPRRQRLRAAYDEWRDAIDEEDPQLEALHNAWVRMVLEDALEFDHESLASREQLAGSIRYRSPDGVESSPDYAVRSENVEPRLLIAVYPHVTNLENPLPDGAWIATPSERMTLLCRSNGCRVGLVTNGEEWMLVNAPVGETSGYASWFARLWWQEPTTLKAFVSLLGVRRCFGPEEDRLPKLLERSLEFQEEVTTTLGEQVRRAVEVLIQSLGRANQDRNGELLKDVKPAELYEAGLTVMMRLVFILSAEERGLLLLGDPLYDQHYSVSALRAKLREDADHYGVEVLERRHDAWSRLLATFRGIFGGIEHEALRLPALGGSLFDPDRFPFLEGRASGTRWSEEPAVPLPIDNRTVLLLMTALQVLEQRGGAQLLSYRALDVEQIGHVYEGLLEFTAERVPEVTLGLLGTKKLPNPQNTLSELESLGKKGSETLIDHLKEITGRSVPALRKSLQVEENREKLIRLIQAANGDENLAKRLFPFGDIIRADSWGNLLVYRQGSFAIVKGTDRRSSGTHYTPRTLTEPIVRHTLEPLVYVGPAEGHPKEEWKLKSSADILSLKVCDMACGSGAFLVEACRYLSLRLVETWAVEETKGLYIDIDGDVRESLGDHEPLPKSQDDRLLIARRLVAQSCLYGVDINHLAVELAKLSIWLVTLAKNKPFSFLDHALRCGDSLVGLDDIEQLRHFSLKPDTKQMDLFKGITTAVDDAISFRLKLEDMSSNTVEDVHHQVQLLYDAEVRTARLRCAADALVSAELWAESEVDKKVRTRQAFEKSSDYLESGPTEDFEHYAAKERRGQKTFHWPLEFPEVIVTRGGFDAFVGNPPFLGNRLWKSLIGDHMQRQAEIILGQSPGKIDLSVVFHRRVVEMLRDGGGYGLLATTNIAEGTAIPIGLGEICKKGEIIFATKVFKWPGNAAVTSAVVCFFKGPYKGIRQLDGEEVEHIGPRLESLSKSTWEPKPVPQPVFSFEGVNNSKGLAFVITPEDAWFDRLKNEAASLLRPYITGNDITTYSLNRLERWALDIGGLGLEAVHSANPLAYRFLMEVVKPTRTPQLLKSYKGLIDRWWQYWNNRVDLMRRVRKHQQVIVFSKITKHPICMRADASWIYTNKVVLIEVTRSDLLAIFLSAFFSEWIVAQQGAKFGVGASLTLAIREAFDTFVLPSEQVSRIGISAADEFEALALNWCKRSGAGLTRFIDEVGDQSCDDSDILKARDLLTVIDREVSGAYGVDGLDLERDFRAAHYIVGESSAYIVSESARANIVDYMTSLNRESCQQRSRSPLREHDERTSVS